MALTGSAERQVRGFDGTTVREPGRTGSHWRLHYSVTLPALGCDYFKMTCTKGVGTGESLKQFPIQPEDYVLVDRSHSTVPGLRHVVDSGGYVTVRVNTGALSFESNAGEPFDLLAAVESLQHPGKVGVWTASVAAPAPIPGRICALHKTDEAFMDAKKRIHKTAQRKGKKPLEAILRYARHVILFTTFPANQFSATEVLEWYRLRWQVELVFKRFKSLAQSGQLPKLNDESAQAWL